MRRVIDDLKRGNQETNYGQPTEDNQNRKRSDDDDDDDMIRIE